MDILERITQMRIDRGWTEYQLAEKSGLTQSTISSWYRKNMIPSIPSLEKICHAYQITLSQFFLTIEDNTIDVDAQQKRLLEYYARLNPKQQENLLAFLSEVQQK